MSSTPPLINDHQPEPSATQRGNSEDPASVGFWPDYRTMWRWHFYAGVFCIPIVIVLSISGAIYLFKSEIEVWMESDYDHLTISSPVHSAADQIQAVLTSLPGATFSSYEIPTSPTSAGRVIVRQDGESIRAYVHPETLAILGTVNDSERFMRQIFHLHGELWMGDRGSHLVELTASWTIILILTGLILWWPRNVRGLGGILYPRFHKGQRVMWRDLHSVTGIWVSFLVLFLLVSGLPWSKFWGDYFRTVRSLTGTASVRQDWSNNSDRIRSSRSRTAAREHGDHGSGKNRNANSSAPSVDLNAINTVLPSVIPLSLPAPVIVFPPKGGTGAWSVKSMTPNRPQRVNLVVDGRTGKIVSRDGFGDRPILDQMVAVGIAAHEGRLFGWPNQLLGLIAALGLIMLSLSGIVLWWRRREKGVLGAPESLVSRKVSIGFMVLVALLGIYLPLFGASLLIVLVLERVVLRRIPRIRSWLGLRAPAAAP